MSSPKTDRKRGAPVRAPGLAGAVASARRYRLIVLSCLLGGALVGLLDQVRRSPAYEATARVIVRGVDVSSRNRGGEQNSNRLVTTLAELVDTPEVLDQAAARGRLGTDDRERLERATSVTTKVDSDVIDISTRWDSRDDAIRLANAVAESFKEYRRQIDIGPLIAAEADLRREIERRQRAAQGDPVLQSLVAAQIDLQRDIQLGGRNSIIAQADVAKQVAPRPRRGAAIGGVLGLLGGIGLVSLLGRSSGRNTPILGGALNGGLAEPDHPDPTGGPATS